jgi:predicted permease
MALGWALKRAFKFPNWSVPAICFNNTTALPLLLIQSLSTAGILSDLLMDDDDTTSAALKRAKSYFLVSAMVGNSLTFAVGPKLLDDEESPDDHDKDKRKSPQERQREEDEEHFEEPRNQAGRTAEEEEELDNENTSLLPDSVTRHAARWREEISEEGERHWVKLPRKMQVLLGFLDGFLNAPLIGALLGGLVGLVPFLHTLFFNEPEKGGYFKAWLTESIDNVGNLFPALQLVVVGAKLSTALMKMKKGEDSGRVPWIPVVVIFFIRFILWPA